ncbi:MAG: nitroreductase family protein [Rickettsiales bacterium]|jgi:nitroreductase|nr:nitroreductase family protein [Rickettsiales bacterium]
MSKNRFKFGYAAAAVLVVAAGVFAFSKHKTISKEAAMSMPAPQKTGGMPLFDALAKRHSSREFADTPVSAETLSTLLWAAGGLKDDGEHRVAPTAKNAQEIEIYVIDASGAYFFDHRGHSLDKVTDENLTASASNYGAPLALALVADSSKYMSRDMAYADCGFVGQNIYLAATSLGLSGVFMASTYDRPALSKALKLKKGQELLFVHALGYGK